MRALSIACLVLSSLAGCGADGADAMSVTDQGLSSSYGGVSESAEAPEFADSSFAAGDLALDDAAVGEAAPANGTVAARVLLVWGYLKPEVNATQIVDWSGTVSVGAGSALRVVRAVRFEAKDSIVRPRTSADTVAFDSHTRPAADGLLLEVVTRAGAAGPVSLTFTSAPITHTFTFTPGQRVSEVLDVDPAGHKLLFHAVGVDHDACTEGFLRGHWGQVISIAGRSLGVLRGRSFGADGAVTGHLRGVYGERKDGKRVFFAKLIDEDGKFVALVAGTYDAGVLSGRLLLPGKVIGGVVRGRFFTDGDADRDGRFIARVSKQCQEDPAEGQAMPSDDAAPPAGN
jgi:hypothetical protein